MIIGSQKIYLNPRILIKLAWFRVMPGGEPTALCRGASRQRYAGGRADSVMPGGGPTALCPDSVMPRQRYAQRYAFPALCLAGVMPFCTRKIYQNTLYLARFCMKYALFRSFLHEKTQFLLKKCNFSEKTNNNKEAETIGLYKTAYCI